MGFFLSCWTQKIILKNVCNQTVDYSIYSFISSCEVKSMFVYPHSSKYPLLCSAEEWCSYRFGTTWGQVSSDRIAIFGVNYPFNIKTKKCSHMPHYRHSRCLCVCHSCHIMSHSGLLKIADKPVQLSHTASTPF